FSFALNANADETLTSVVVTINHVGSSTVSSDDLKKLEVYEDTNNNGVLDTANDQVAGSESTVNVDTPTTIDVNSHNSLTGKKFFVALSTDDSWSGTSPADKITATLATDGVTTSADSPTFSADITTSAISAPAPDITGPILLSAVAHNSSGTKTVVLTFSEATNSPSITASNINDVLVLNNTHSWLDGAGDIGSANWSSDSKVLTITLSANTSSPNVAVGDNITITGSSIQDSDGNNATGTVTITGSLTSNSGEGDDTEGEGQPCTNTLINGRLYKVSGDANTTVYLAANCTLRPFRGAAVFHARGGKFLNIIVVSSLDGFTVSDKPALPAEGTLVKGSNATVWFIEHGEKRKGFASASAFLGLGFRFDQVNQITDDDLNTIPVDTDAVTNDTQHPDGSLVKCQNSNTVFQVIGGTEFPFTSVDEFELRGHSFDHIANIDCGRFHYVQGSSI
ncbi:MAG TPA: hypothetical protein VL306_00735, partial [Methylomirabilota bacterium]|nr:hypothetical protein [Methylomirabilota bacterium]